MAQTTHKVVAGDNLTKIAAKYNTTVNKLVELNDLPDPNYIVVGQVLIIDGEKAEKTTVLNAPVVDIFGLQSGTTRTIYAAWPSWTQADTDHYEVRWYWDNGDAIGWVRDVNSTVDNRQSIYSGAPESALRVRFVMRPVAKHENDEEPPWTAPWSTEKIYVFADNPPSTPPTHYDVTIDSNCHMTITIDNIDVGNADYIEFQIAKIARDDDEHSEIFHTGLADINIAVNSVTYRCRVDAGCLYKVRCRSARGTLTSDWSTFSNTVGAIPIAPGQITDCVAKSEDSVYLKWTSVASATSYNVQHTTDESYFDLSNRVTTESDFKTNECIITGLEKGVTHYFRVQAVNAAGTSGWSTIVSTKVGSKPTSPTTWSSKSTAVIGDIIRLSWAHNVEDGSDQTGYKLELNINGIIDTHEYDTSDEFVDIDTNELANEDSTIIWKVKTKGVTGEYCDEWSVARTIKVYVKPSLTLGVTDVNGNFVEKLTSFPFYISGTTFPITQKSIGYHISITSNQEYDAVNNLGKEIFVKEGELVYSEHIDNSTNLHEEISADKVTLENNMKYTITVIASLDSGLTAEASYGDNGQFQVAWVAEQYVPNASIYIDKDTLTASIRPYCVDSKGDIMEDAYVSVYRRDFDGRFTEIDSNVDCAKCTYVTDPHPALDYARYRIVAKSKSTGTISYYDMPGIKVGEKAAVIQWDEKWSSFESMTEMESSTPPWSGSLLKLPYNLDVSYKYQQDVQHVEYIGREHPVSYHGTQTGESCVWNVDVPKTDAETLYTLHRLSIWRGNVYVREPSGSGYWATVTVSLNKKHKVLTVPVTISIIRVEGGV